MRKLEIYPLFLAVYPILALLAANIDQIEPEAAFRSIMISLIVTIILYIVLFLVIRDYSKVALILSLSLILFYTYGHLRNYLYDISIFGLLLGRHRFLVPLWIIILAVISWAILKAKFISTRVNQALFFSTIILLAFPSFQIVKFYYSSYQAVRAYNTELISQPIITDKTGDLPDIYLIILDKYARKDVLLNQYEYDNQGFITDLRELGFYVPECSLSNYGQTKLSLASQLNFNTIQALMGQSPSTTLELYFPYIKQSAVRKQLEAMGYRMIAFETGFTFSEIKDADLYLTPPQKLPETAFLNTSNINPFEAMLIKTTAILALPLRFTMQQVPQNTQYIVYNRDLFILDSLENIPFYEGKKLVFAHIMTPHEPYVFKQDGNFQTDTDFYSAKWGIAIDSLHDSLGYRNQIEFINGRMIPLLKKIIANSEKPPVILLFSDHGVNPPRNANLAAYYLPGKGEDALYPTITSVNSFRLVFNRYFQSNYSMLPDTSYSIEEETDIFSFSIYQDNCQPSD